MEAATIVMDTHVHFHQGVSEARCLDLARRNFDRWAPVSDPIVRALLLVESPGVHRYRALEEEQVDTGAWKVAKTLEPTGLWARHADGYEILLMAGVQVPAAERLEVLGLGVVDSIAGGSTLENTLDQVLERGGVGVVPWGFGKWTGARGKCLEKILAASERRPVLLGDNGGRPRAWPEPRHFELGRHRSIPVVAGSDPFPLPGEEARIASYGSFLKNTPFDPDAPASSILEALRALRASPPTFGRRVGSTAFLRAQIGLRVGRMA